MIKLFLKIWQDIDIKTRLDVLITFIATFISLLFIISTYIFKTLNVEILSILIIVLPTIYVIGNLLIRDILTRELEDYKKINSDALSDLDESIEEYEDKIDRLNNQVENLLKENDDLRQNLEAIYMGINPNDLDGPDEDLMRCR